MKESWILNFLARHRKVFANLLKQSPLFQTIGLLTLVEPSFYVGLKSIFVQLTNLFISFSVISFIRRIFVRVLFFTPDLSVVLVPSDCEAARLSCLLLSGSCSSRVCRLLRRGPCGPSSLFSCLLLSPHTAKLATMLIVRWGASVFPPPFVFFAHPAPNPSCSNIDDSIQYFYRSPHPPPVPLVSPIPLADSISPQKPNQCQLFCDPSLCIFWPLEKKKKNFSE